MNSKAFWLIIIAIILFSAIFLWYNHTSTQETLIKAQETIEETKQALRESEEALKKNQVVVDLVNKIAKEKKATVA